MHSDSSNKNKFLHKYLIWFCVISVIIFSGSTQNSSNFKKTKYKVIAYVGSRADIHGISAKKLTHINYAFAQVNPEGEVIFKNPNSPAHICQLQALKAKNPDLKILLSIGGWGADNFSDAALTDSSRLKFTKSIIAFVKNYALDGIDLDWEYPGQPGPGIKYRIEDKENFTSLLRTLRTNLDSLSNAYSREDDERFLLTIASTDREYFQSTEMEKLHVYLDWINIMTYDFYNSLTNTTGHHTGLFRSNKAGDNIRSTESSVKQHLDAGIPRDKLVIGAAFYGRSFYKVNPEKNGLFQPYKSYWRDFPYFILTKDYVNKQGFKRMWDNSAKAPFLWNADSSIFISYDDKESIKEKTSYIKLNNLGGIMYWEHSNDPAEELLNVMYENLR